MQTTTKNLAMLDEFLALGPHNWPRKRLVYRDRQTRELHPGPIAFLLHTAAHVPYEHMVDQPGLNFGVSTDPKNQKRVAQAWAVVEEFLGIPEGTLFVTDPERPGQKGFLDVLKKLQAKKAHKMFRQTIDELADV